MGYNSPVRYGDRSQKAMVNILDAIVDLSYEVRPRKRFFITQSHIAFLNATIDEGVMAIPHTYEMPADFRIDSAQERQDVENGLYRLIDEIVRSVVQIRAIREEEVNHLRALTRPLATCDSADNDEETGTESLEQLERESTLRYKQQLEKDSHSLVDAMRRVTRITTLNWEDYSKYHKSEEGGEEKIYAPFKEPNPRKFLTSLMAYLDIFARSEDDVVDVQQKTLVYLQRQNNSNVGGLISAQNVETIVNEWVVTYWAARRARKLPHLTEELTLDRLGKSAFEGGVIGFLVSLGVEAIIDNATGSESYIPGFFIGTGLQYFWPFIRAPFSFASNNIQFYYSRRRLIQTGQHALELSVSGEKPDIQGLIDERIKMKLLSEGQQGEEDANHVYHFLYNCYKQQKNRKERPRDIREATLVTELALSKHELPLEDIHDIIDALSRKKSTLKDLSQAVAVVIGGLGPLESRYKISDVVNEIRRSKRGSLKDGKTLQEIATTAMGQI